MTFYDMTWLERLLFLKRIKGGSGHEETTTSNSFVTDMVAPLRKLLLSFAPKQSGSGDPSPDNVRPISGWDSVSVIVSPTLDTEEGQTYTTSLGQTVYGGTLDMVSGVLTVDAKCFEITELTLYGNYQSHPLYYCDIPNYQTEPIKRSAIASDEGIIVCDRFSKIKTSAVKTMGDLQVRTNENYSVNKFYFRYDGLNSLADFNAELAQNPMQLVASLATPQTYQLTPQEINTLIGTNNIITDAEVSEIVYLKKAE